MSKYYGGPYGYIDIVEFAKSSAAGPMTKQEYLDFVQQLFGDMHQLISAKNADYTAGGGPFANFTSSQDFGVDPLVGLMLRMSDKFQRLKSFATAGKLQSSDSLEDTFKDLIGYSCIALGMLKERSNS